MWLSKWPIQFDRLRTVNPSNLQKNTGSNADQSQNSMFLRDWSKQVDELWDVLHYVNYVLYTYTVYIYIHVLFLRWCWCDFLIRTAHLPGAKPSENCNSKTQQKHIQINLKHMNISRTTIRPRASRCYNRVYLIPPYSQNSASSVPSFEHHQATAKMGLIMW